MEFRAASTEDLEEIVGMLADDVLGARRERFEKPLPDVYWQAFDRIQKDPNNELVVAVEGDQILGTLQISFIPYLTFQGGLRAQIEAVRVHKNHRGKGLGKQFFQWAIERARSEGCHLVQLTTNKERDKAKDFYGALGFEASHEGMKLYLKPG